MQLLLPSNTLTSYSLRSANAVQEDEEELVKQQSNTEATDSIDYSSYTEAQLKEKLDNKGINYTNTMKKAYLIALLEESDRE